MDKKIEKLSAGKRRKLEALENMIREDEEDDCSILFRGKFKK